MEAPEDMDHETLMEHVAWSEESMIAMLWRFIIERDLRDDAEKFLDKIALEECAECKEDSDAL